MPKQSIFIGDEFTNNYGDTFVVINYEGSSKVTVRFESGYVTSTQAVHIRMGVCRDVFSRKMFGVGYVGDGPHKPSVNRVMTREYCLWKRIHERSYSEKYHKIRPTYEDVTVSEEWQCFQTFAEDIKELQGYDKWLLNDGSMELDKDVKIPGNKTYSKEACMFITASENTHDANRRRELNKEK